jgi:hypothetical protein
LQQRASLSTNGYYPYRQGEGEPYSRTKILRLSEEASFLRESSFRPQRHIKCNSMTAAVMEAK